MLLTFRSLFEENVLGLVTYCLQSAFLWKISNTHFTVVCLVAWPMNASEAGGDLALIQTSLLFHLNAS